MLSVKSLGEPGFEGRGKKDIRYVAAKVIDVTARFKI